MDGFAVRSSDTFGAGKYSRFADPYGNILMGKTREISTCRNHVHPHRRHAPASSDSVVMVEFSEILRSAAILAPLPIGEHDPHWRRFRRGKYGFSAGQGIRYQDVGVLSALACLELDIFPPQGSFPSTGDEIISPKEQPKPGQIRDINGLALQRKC